MTRFSIHRLEANKLPEIVASDTLEISMEVMQLLMPSLGEHAYTYEDRHYWWAEIVCEGIGGLTIRKPLTILTRGDGSAAIMYPANDPRALTMIRRLVEELIAIDVALVIVEQPLTIRQR